MNPLKKPKRLKAISPYSEHVGTNLQHEGKSGEINPLYSIMIPIAIYDGTFFMKHRRLFIRAAFIQDRGDRTFLQGLFAFL